MKQKKLTIHDIANLLGVDITGIYSLRRKGVFPKPDIQGTGCNPNYWYFKSVKKLVAEVTEINRQIESGELIDIGGMVELLGLTRETIYRKIACRELPEKVKIPTNNRKSYWRKSDVEKYLVS